MVLPSHRRSPSQELSQSDFSTSNFLPAQLGHNRSKSTLEGSSPQIAHYRTRAQEDAERHFPLKEPPLPQPLQIPQYRQAFFQGCGCKIGINGVLCCFGSLSFINIPMSLPTAAWLNVGASIIGLLQSCNVIGRSDAARFPLYQLENIQATHDPNYLKLCKKAQEEQTFFLVFPGFLQVFTNSIALICSVAMLLGVHAIHTVFHPLICLLSVFYFMGLATFYTHQWFQLHLSRTTQNPQLSALVQTYQKEKKEHCACLGLGSAATAVLIASNLAISLGYLAVCIPYANAILALLILGANIFCAWQLCQNRFNIHIPTQEKFHNQSLFKNTNIQKTIQLEIDLIKKTNKQLIDQLSFSQKLRYRLEEAIQPQCGPKAFRVLPKAISKKYFKALSSSPPQHTLTNEYQDIILHCISQYIKVENSTAEEWDKKFMETQEKLCKEIQQSWNNKKFIQLQRNLVDHMGTLGETRWPHQVFSANQLKSLVPMSQVQIKKNWSPVLLSEVLEEFLHCFLNVHRLERQADFLYELELQHHQKNQQQAQPQAQPQACCS